MSDVNRAANNNTGCFAGGGGIYLLGIIGSLVWFWQQADEFGEYVWAIIQSLFWPAVMVYEVFQQLAA